MGMTPHAKAIVLLAALLLLRCVERTLVRPHTTILQETARPHSHLSVAAAVPPVSPPPSRVAAIAHPADGRSQDPSLPRYLRPLDAVEARELWRDEVGGWLATHAPALVASADVTPPRSRSQLRGCRAGCGGNGTCQEDVGVCHCRSGWEGEACERRKAWQCNADDGRYLWSRCAGECDTRYGYCYCGARAKFPRRPLLQCEPRGVEKVITPWKTSPINEAEKHDWHAIWGKTRGEGGRRARSGWCDANASVGEQPAATCACRYDGLDGYLCQSEVPQFCLNQCSARGECHHGFCLCNAGWWGIDCSRAARPSGEGPSRARGTVAAEVGKQRRGRPLIYVYEMPSSVTTDLLQRRHDKHFCAHRTYLQRNRTQYAYGIYQGYVLELMLHEWLLASPHRTLDPSKADWFYVPVYASCAIVTSIFETPTSRRVKYRLALAQQLYLRALEYISSRFPYWNVSGGTDHVWTFGYDEGACFAPAAIQQSVLISHWGNTMLKHNRCTTTYEADRWDPPFDPLSKLPLHSVVGRMHCYDPKKDIVLPSFRELTTFLPVDARDAHRKRRRLFFFSGDLGSPAGARNAGPHTHPNYSMGIRQAVYRTILAANSSRLQVTGHFERDWYHIQYHAAMKDAVFCGAFPGDGWSGGISSAIFLGCIPVVIMDGVHMPFENVLNYSSFSVRVAEEDIPQLPQILMSIRSTRVREMQRNLHRLRARFGYASLAVNELRLNKYLTLGDDADNTRAYLGILAAASVEEEDALQTLLRLLLFRASQRHSDIFS
ncbi:hypothetical protein AB1Y20_005299 [Prymnesium parvum]|uniref:EGF-like domain-containing protein n=1 Tax=Prymnesium parvum TaxID=97485 RepID=A0AB34J644_PRYPA